MTTVQPTGPDPDPETGRADVPFGWGLAAVVAVGAVIRLVYVLWLHRVGHFMIGDSYVYHQEGLQVADGVGYVSPVLWQTYGVRSELAMHPPLYSLWLAGWSSIGLRSLLAHQLATVPLGLATIATVGVLGRRLVSPAVGLVAAAIVALHPSIWSWEGMLLQEPIAILAAAALTLAMLGLVRRITVGNVALAGLAAGLAPLTRAELLVACVVCALAIVAAHRTRSAVAGVAASGLLAMACVAPWTIHNSLRFSRSVPLSNGLGVTMAGTHCDELGGEFLGYWSFVCMSEATNDVTAAWRAEHPDAEAIELPPALLEYGDGASLELPATTIYPDLDEAELDARLREATFTWMGDHPGYLARSVAARYGRVLGVYRPLQQMDLDVVPDGRKRPVVVGSWLGYYLLLPFVAVGVRWMVRRRRWAELAVVAAPTVAVLSAIALTWGSTRYRTLAEPGMAVLAAIGIVVVGRWINRTWQADGDHRRPVADQLVDAEP